MRLYSLQALRFWAALAVVLFHAAATAHSLTGSFGVLGERAALAGRAGVDVFFVLSGVVIAISSRGLTAAEFIAKRARRIYPIYFLLVAPWLIFAAQAGLLDWRHMAATFLLWPVTDRVAMPVLGPAWSLCFEALFYAAAAAVVWRKGALPVLLAAYVAALTIRSGPVLQFVGNPLTLEFLAGVALAQAPRFRAARWLLPIGLLILAATSWAGLYPDYSPTTFITGEHGWTRLVALGLPAVLIVAGALPLDARPGVLTYLGDASYSLYLVHTLVILGLSAAARMAGLNLSPDVFIFAAAAASVLAAWRIHELFEKPLLAWLRRRPGRLTPAKA